MFRDRAITQIYGSQFFHVEPQMNVDIPDEVFLAVNPRGILIINPETKDVLVEHPYSEVPTWGHTGMSFVLHIGNLLKQTKLYFQVRCGAAGVVSWDKGGVQALQRCFAGFSH